MSDWHLVYEDYRPGQERLREALCTLGNGYFATRGAAPECRAGEHHYPGTYAAGVYDRLSTEIAGRSIENESLVNLPNWLTLRLRIGGGEWLRPEDLDILEYRQTLDLRRGVLERQMRCRDGEGRTLRIDERRLVHMRWRHLAGLRTTVTAEDWSGPLEVLSGLDGRVENAGVARYRDLAGDHLRPLEAEALDAHTLLLKVETRQSEIRIAQAARTRLLDPDGQPIAAEPVLEREQGWIAHRYRVDLERGVPLQIEKLLALYTSQDKAISECALEARDAAGRLGDFEDLARSHGQFWGELWQRFDLELSHDDPEVEDRTERILRLHLFHLLQTGSPHVMDLDTGIPARGLHGEAYRGHVFWDELFAFPLLNLRMPEITRALLRYRYRRLDAARQAAADAGYRGAMYPWQSGSNGREESQRLHLNPRSGRWIPDRSRLQRHVSSAVAYNVWQYYQVTHDREFLDFYGAEMILEIARFWASKARYDEDADRYEILGVMGPDEYHDGYPGAEEGGLDNNAYTNLMAVWVLCRALELADVLPGRRFDELCEQLDLGREELELWERVSRRMRVVFHREDPRIISQFEGYEDLEPFDWEGYRRRYGDIQRLDRILEAEDDTPNRYQVSKQADVLMLFYLFSAEELEELLARLGYDFDPQSIPANIEYYLQRTSHGSTLSRVVHSWVMARSDREGAWELFCQALESDVTDVQGGTTEEGIHMGAMAGTVDLIQRCFTGIETRGDVLYLHPVLPRELRSLKLDIRYRQHEIALHITPTHLRVATRPLVEHPVRIAVVGEIHELAPGESREYRL